MVDGRLVVEPGGSLRGTIRVPGDKSISHRSVLFASLLRQRITIEGFLRSDDCLHTVAACRALGVPVEDDGETVVVTGQGMDGLGEPADVIDVGNAGTAIRLLVGLLAGQSFYAVLTGDASIRRRPMDRVVEPLRRMGASIWGRDGGALAPLSVRGTPLRGQVHDLSVASAQVKSCLLIAGLFADGATEVREPAPSRDHTERMLTALGAPLEWEPGSVRLREGGVSLQSASTHWRIPGDFSSAAFFLVGALITPDSDLTVCDVGVNPTRTGLLDVLWEMGADISVQNPREWNGEPVADLRVRSSRLRAVDIGGPLIPRLIDELPIFAVAAAHARGTSRVRDAAELRVKESNRIDGLAAQLGEIGIRAIPADDGFSVPGDQTAAGGLGHSLGDHRIAMSLAIAGLTARAPVAVQEPGCISASFPGFSSLLDAARGRGEKSVRVEGAGR